MCARRRQEADLTFRRTLFGLSRDPPRWRICLHTLNTFAPDTVGTVYLADAAGPATAPGRAAAAEGLLGRLRDEMRGVLQRSAWMTPASRAVARKKLAGMRFAVGGPQDPTPLGFAPGPRGSWFDDSVRMAPPPLVLSGHAASLTPY